MELGLIILIVESHYRETNNFSYRCNQTVGIFMQIHIPFHLDL